MKKQFILWPLLLMAFAATLIYTDDHGYVNLGCVGVMADVKTPNIDALAKGFTGSGDANGEGFGKLTAESQQSQPALSQLKPIRENCRTCPTCPPDLSARQTCLTRLTLETRSKLPATGWPKFAYKWVDSTVIKFWLLF